MVRQYLEGISTGRHHAITSCSLRPGKSTDLQGVPEGQEWVRPNNRLEWVGTLEAIGHRRSSFAQQTSGKSLGPRKLASDASLRIAVRSPEIRRNCDCTI
jgi:hypothetical protein